MANRYDTEGRIELAEIIVKEGARGKITQKEITNAKVLHSHFTQETPDLKADIVLMSLVLGKLNR